MVNLGKVKSNMHPTKINITKDAVFIAKNVENYIDDYGEGYEYDLFSYTKDEYIQYIAEQNQDLEQQLLDTQLALCEIYEGRDGVVL